MEDRVHRLDRAVSDQRAFLHRIPDPDTRERAEGHLLTLIDMRNAAVASSGSLRVGQPTR